MDRRQLLLVLGGGAITGACAPGVDPTLAWRDPGVAEHDPRRRALSWGILAPNPHNMQPWMVDLSRPDEATLFLAADRLLPQTDPFNRQIVIGCGAFCELTRMAAAREGWRVTLDPFPNGDAQPTVGPKPVARLRFQRAPAESDPLLAVALKRRTNRTPFEARAVVPAHAEAICAAARRPGVAASATVAPERVAALRAIAFEGARTEAYTPAAHKESIERTFFGEGEIAAHPYGVSIRGALPEVAHAVGLLSPAVMEDRSSFGFKQALAFLETAADTARGFVWLTTPENGRTAQFEAGRAYLRANLQATALGLAMHPWSQCLQEYAAMSPSLRAVQRALAPEGGRVQMFVRIGYGQPVAPAPKRGLDAQILRA